MSDYLAVRPEGYAVLELRGQDWFEGMGVKVLHVPRFDEDEHGKVTYVTDETTYISNMQVLEAVGTVLEQWDRFPDMRHLYTGEGYVVQLLRPHEMNDSDGVLTIRSREAS